MHNTITFKKNSPASMNIEIFSSILEHGNQSDIKALKDYLQIYIMREYGGSARSILDNSLPRISKIALSEQMIEGFILRYKDVFLKAYKNTKGISI